MFARPLDDYPRWMGYDDLDGPLSQVPVGEARAVFARFLADRAERLETLQAFLSETAGLSPPPSETGVAQLEAWLWPWLEDWIREGDVEPEQHSALLHDVGVFAGEALIGERPGIEWQLLTKGPRSQLGYQFPVLAPFPEGYEPYWAVTRETVADGYALGNSVLDPARPRLRPRLLHRYRIFAGLL